MVRVGGERAGELLLQRLPRPRRATRALARAPPRPRWSATASAPGASRLVVGDTDRAPARWRRGSPRFERAEAALLFNCGYAANVGRPPRARAARATSSSPTRSTTPRWSTAAGSRARTSVVYPHARRRGAGRGCSREHARRAAGWSSPTRCSPWTATRRRCASWSTLCRAHGAALMVDEAHATGVLGRAARGLCEALGLEAEVDLRMGTLGKALGGFGAYVATSRAVAELLVNRARPLVFSTALPAAAVRRRGGARWTWWSTTPALRERLWRNIQPLRRGAARAGPPGRAAQRHLPGRPGRARARRWTRPRRLRERGPAGEGHPPAHRARGHQPAALLPLRGPHRRATSTWRWRPCAGLGVSREPVSSLRPPASSSPARTPAWARRRRRARCCRCWRTRACSPRASSPTRAAARP